MYTFESIDEFISSFEHELMETLNYHDLLTHFNSEVKSILFLFFVKTICKKLKKQDLILYYAGLSDDHDLIRYFGKPRVESYVHDIISKRLIKMCNRIIILPNGYILPHRAMVPDLDGVVIDEMMALSKKRQIPERTIFNRLKRHNLEFYLDSISSIWVHHSPVLGYPRDNLVYS